MAVNTVINIQTPSAFTNINVVKITSSGTYTPSKGLSFCVVELYGAGGGSPGITINTANSAGGGGGGGYCLGIFTAAQIGASQSVTIGAGSAGATGGATTFSTLTANGGTASGATAAGGTIVGSPIPSQGGLGGTASGGLINARGCAGSNGFGFSVGTSIGGHGGSCIYGQGGTPGSTTGQGNDGAANTGAGAGGGVGYAAAAVTASAGGSGLCVITEYLKY